ncbi:MAG TPA: serine/threonine-protein kinase [Cyclobacteriaceae bacterium]|nr:serine/threonine-protein kinase [Cyclobacteriaceae bacterium]HRJ81207.1 serine/threonine-protein kinase [Cyclobacteriaceae bacterium]
MDLKFIETIGQGGFGIVDRVSNKKGDILARKMFLVSIKTSPDLHDHVKKRFIREAKVQKQFVHKNIVPVLDEDLEIDPPYFLMPVAESSLADDIEKDRTLKGNYMQAMMDIIAGLEEIHKIRIYHRDLKPQNVLRFNDSNGKDYYAIGDFGLMSVDQTNVSTITQTGMRMGSDAYTAPEIVKDLTYASVRSDIYSLGCILHDFVGTDKRIPCNEIKESGDFSGILLNCTRKDASRRFKSVTAVRDALLSMGDIKAQPETSKGEAIFELLNTEPDKLKEKHWKDIVDFVDDEHPSADSIAVLRRLTIDHLDKVNEAFPMLAGRLGLLYAKWIRESSFPFAECDGLSIRLQKFINNCDIDVQAECLMAMLYMGTSHNRWYVENKFVNIVGRNLDEILAKRLALEIRVDDEAACKAFEHLNFSIQFDIQRLHPVLLHTVKAICS